MRYSTFFRITSGVINGSSRTAERILRGYPLNNFYASNKCVPESISLTAPIGLFASGLVPASRNRLIKYSAISLYSLFSLPVQINLFFMNASMEKRLKKLGFGMADIRIITL